MAELDVRIVQLEPLHVASVYGFGSSPEMVAWEKLMAWAGPRNLLADRSHRIFGFNNPSPAAGSPNYGYEFWITVDPDVQAGEGVTLRDFAGGLYAVTRCQGVEQISPTWRKLVTWLAASPYQNAQHQWLEEHLGPVDASPETWSFDLYAPIAK